jgi:predicted unusual protein kinase regulating ubiquinone biosynthesis (AarF/ABC1/UbiB family)
MLDDNDVQRTELATCLDEVFADLNDHPISSYSRDLTAYLRQISFLPNEESTENLIRFLVKQAVLRSPVDIPEPIVEEFWLFFQELIESPELEGIVELNLEIIRSVIVVYEPLLVELINNLKQLRRLNRDAMQDMMQKVSVLRGDIVILKRQIKAIRYIKPFLQTDPKDFKTQAEIVAKMVREFGPLFVKMAQVAAASADFLPEEIAAELKVFQEDVSPMTEEEVRQAFAESYGEQPEGIFYGFDVSKPLKSGSIGSVYLAKKPFLIGEKEVLRPVIVKVARHNLEREFSMGALAIELMILSSQYWAPHSKLKPFLGAMSEQLREFTRGFEQELDFVAEAHTQQRFHERAQSFTGWSVPEVYRSSPRILEMQYVDQAQSMAELIASSSLVNDANRRQQLADNFMYTVIMQLFIFQEFHGDLHPGNIMVCGDTHLSLIDWGNVVNMQGKWPLLFDYLFSALSGDVENLADSLIAMSTEEQKNKALRTQLIAQLRDTLKKREVTPLDRFAVFTLYQEGSAGFTKRLSCAASLLSNTYQMGITIKSDYFHLSRSIIAISGTYGSMFINDSKILLARELSFTLLKSPFKYGLGKLAKDVYARYRAPVDRAPVSAGVFQQEALALST